MMYKLQEKKYPILLPVSEVERNTKIITQEHSNKNTQSRIYCILKVATIIYTTARKYVI